MKIYADALYPFSTEPDQPLNGGSWMQFPITNSQQQRVKSGNRQNFYARILSQACMLSG
jgi:hypothetical protein